MKKNKLYLLSAIIMCNLFLLNFENIYKQNIIKHNEMTVFASTKINNTTVESKPNIYEKDYIKVSLDIPIILGLNNKEIEKSINDRIKNIIVLSKDNVESLAKEDAEQSVKNGYDITQYNFFNKYRVNYNKDNILSLTLILYQYTGGAHGSTNEVTYNFDLNTGKIGVLKDFLGNNTDYRSLIVNKIRDDIEKQPENYFVETINNFNGIPFNQQFYLDSDGVVIYFNEYEIAPYAAGIPEFKIPYNSFKNGLKKDVIIKNDPINISSQTMNLKKDNFQSYLQYPLIKNLKNIAIESKINNILRKEVLDFNEKIKNMQSVSLKNNVSEENNKAWSAATSFTSYLVNEDLLSLLITYSANNGSNENLMLYDKGYNIDLNSGVLYTLKDVFKQGINYKELINKEINNQISNIDPKANIYKFSSINADTQFYFQNGDLIITFGSGEIAPNEYYNPHFIIPLKKFNGFINPRFIEH